jgi:hypothetical protein
MTNGKSEQLTIYLTYSFGSIGSVKRVLLRWEGSMYLYRYERRVDICILEVPQVLNLL